jgi:AraC-like DNA-binding protein
MNKNVIILALLTLFLPATPLAQGVSNCIRFDGAGGYISAKSTPNIRLTKAITIDFWVKFDKLHEFSSPFSLAVDNGAQESGYSFGIYKSALRFLVKITDGYADDWYLNPGALVEVNQWYHVAGTFDGQVIRFYLNGVLKGFRPKVGEIVWEHLPQELSIGAFRDDNEHTPFTGCVDEFKIWDYALTEEEIQRIMYTKPTGKEPGLVLYYPFDEDYGDTVFDLAGGNNGQLINMKADSRITSIAMMRPTNPESKKLHNGMLQFNWQWDYHDTFTPQFLIDIATDVDFTNTLESYSSLDVGTSTTFEANQPERGRNYYFRVRAYSQDFGFSCHSEILEVKDFASSMSFSIQTETDYCWVIKNGEPILKALRISSNVDALKFVIAQSSVLAELSDSLRFRINRRGSWITVKSKIREYNIINLNPGTTCIEIQAHDGNGNWENKSYRFKLFKHYTYWQYILWTLLLLLIPGYLFIFRRHYRVLITKVITHTSDEINEEIIRCLEEDKLFLKADFSIQELAQATKTNKIQVSDTISKHYKKPFNEVVRSLRIKEVKRRLKDPNNSQYTILSIGLDCGFSSESSFYRIFKQETGVTPTAYAKNKGF